MSSRHSPVWLALGLVLALAGGPAAAATRISIEATVSPEMNAVSGIMHIDTDLPLTLVDPLAAVPEPPDDRFSMQTYPGAPEQGMVRWTRLDDYTVSFYAILPRRFGDLGANDRFGLFANGGWYPQPLSEDGMPEAQWRVEITVPEGSVGVVGDQVGTGTLHWTAIGDRASLAVVPDAEVTPLSVGIDDDVVLVTRGKPREVLVRELTEQLAIASVEGAPWHGVVVEAPLRRRLARPGRSMAYVSDRAFRVSPGFERFHRVGVTRGVMEGLIDHPDPFARSVTAAGLSLRHARTIAGADARSLLQWLSWIPTVDAILHSRTMPFYAEVLEDAHPGDPVQDDLVEMFDLHAPGTAVALQLDDRYGPGTSWVIAEGVLLGLTLDRSAVIAGVSPSWLESWRAPYPEQDYVLTVQRDPPLVVVRREAPGLAPAEALVVVIDGARTVRVAGPGPDEVVLLPPARPSRVSVDPEGHTSQLSRVGDAWPPRYHVSLAAAITAIDLSDKVLYGWAAAFVRRTGDTRNLVEGRIWTNDRSWVGLNLGYARKAGPLITGLSRRHRIRLTVNGSLLSERFASVDDGRFALGTGLGWSWTNQSWSAFPQRGQAFAVGTSAAFVPGSDQRYAGVSAGWTGLASPHPRHAFALNLEGSLAGGNMTHRLPGLGELRSVPVAEVSGNTRQGVARVEYRVAPLRNASVPMLLGFGTELQLSVGAELGSGYADGEWRHVAGLTAGVTGVGDVFGFERRAIGVTVGYPVWTRGFDLSPEPLFLLRWGQAF